MERGLEEREEGELEEGEGVKGGERVGGRGGGRIGGRIGGGGRREHWKVERGLEGGEEVEGGYREGGSKDAALHAVQVTVRIFHIRMSKKGVYINKHCTKN